MSTIKSIADSIGILLICAAAMAFVAAMAQLGTAEGPYPERSQAEESERRYSPDSSGDPSPDVQFEENPCGGLIQQARISARDRAAREGGAK